MLYYLCIRYDTFFCGIKKEGKEKMNNLFKQTNIRNKHVVASLFVIGIILMVIGVSYAMYTFTGTGTTENVITTGQITVAFAEQNNILIQNRYPETDAVGLASTDPNSQMTFTVSSNITGEATVNYAIGLTDIVEGATLKQDHIKIYLTKNGSVANDFTENKGKTIKSFEGYSVTNYLDSHAIAQGSVTGTQTDTYTLKAWIDESYNLPTTDTSSGNVHSNTTTTETFSFKLKAIGTDSSLELKEVILCDEMPEETTSANVPSLAKNMIPVCYNSTKNVWLKADSTNTDSDYRWYSYSGKTWANAVTVTESDGTRDDLVDAEVGTVIPMDRINTMLVWIPRFSATGDTANYNGGTKNAPGAFNITFVNKDTAAHDAFTFGEAVSGFWIGKFENSSNEDCVPADNSAVGARCNLTSIRPKILPNATSWRGAMVSTYFYDILAMTESGNQYGFDKTKDTTLDTHMLKNNEWGAVAYLTQSIYGRCSSSTSCSEVGINNNSSYITGYGAPAGSHYDSSNDAYVAPQAYNTTQGMDASTTGNVYGVYDMSGGAYEDVMGVYWDGTKYWSSGLTATNYNSGFNGCLGSSCSKTLQTGVPYPSDDKYYNLYTTSANYTSAGLQHGMTETSGWYGDSALFVNAGNPWVSRSGFYGHSSFVGVFYFNYSSYGNANANSGSRLSVAIN